MSDRRSFIRAALGLAAGVALFPLKVLAARPTEVFSVESYDEVMQTLFATTDIPAGDVKIKAPEIAENGAVVPISVSYNVPGAEMVTIVVEKNPNPLVAAFSLTDSSGGLVSTRVKMGETSAVHAVVKAGDKFVRGSAEVKVTIGGCGG